MTRSLHRHLERPSAGQRDPQVGSSALNRRRARVPAEPSRFAGYLRDGRSPVPEKELTSRVMSANRGKDTRPEIQLRRQLWAAGLRGYRLHPKGVPGRPDVSFASQKVAVFVHGCFWHHCPRCDLPLPKSHTDFWRAKFERNQLRDQLKVLALESTGWKVLTLWECEIEEDASRCAGEVSQLLRATTRRPERSVLTPEHRKPRRASNARSELSPSVVLPRG
jgi:DNA mismatch endonuclease (patch repair protein)